MTHTTLKTADASLSEPLNRFTPLYRSFRQTGAQQEAP